VQTKLLHLIGDFSQPAILQDMSENSVKISKTYFQNCTASSNPVWSAIDLGSLLSSSVDQPENPQQTETF
jgi:hypothetical protein